jgi:hypothetical protein
MRGRLPNPARAVAVSLVLALHALLLLMFHQPPRERRVSAPAEPFPSLLFLPLPEQPEPETVEPVESAPRPAVSIPRARERPEASSSTPVIPEPITEPPPQPDRDWSSIDWADEARQAARTVIEKRKKYRSLASHAGSRKPRGLASKNKPQFGWDQSSINRVDTSAGIPVLSISDRCHLLLFIVPTCLIGKMEPRGDLFEHMNDVELPEEEEE